MSSIDVAIVAYKSDPTVLDRAVESVLTSRGHGRLLVYINGVDPALREPGPLTEAANSTTWALQWLTRVDNRGYCGANNFAGRWFLDGPATWLFIMNPDVVLTSGCLTTLSESLPREPPAMAGPLLRRLTASATSTDVVDSAGTIWTRSGRHLDYLSGQDVTRVPSQPYTVAGLTGAAMMLNRTCVQTLTERQDGEIFDQTFFAYREDAELGLRAGLLGIAMWVVPSAVAGHVRQLRGTDRTASRRANRLSVQNRFHLRFKYGRLRPGTWMQKCARDAAVIIGVALSERGSLPGLARAFAMRRYTRMRGAAMRERR